MKRLRNTKRMEDAGLLLQERIQGVEGGNALADSAQVREVTKNQEEDPANSDWSSQSQEHKLVPEEESCWRKMLRRY